MQDRGSCYEYCWKPWSVPYYYDGLVPLADRIPVYNLPSAEIPRPNVLTLTPPQGTLIVGPRPVVGGTGNEVIFPAGY